MRRFAAFLACAFAATSWGACAQTPPPAPLSSPQAAWTMETARDAQGRLDGCSIYRPYRDGGVLAFAEAVDGTFMLVYSRVGLSPPVGWEGAVVASVDDGVQFTVPAATVGRAVAVDLTTVAAVKTLLAGGRWLRLVTLADDDYALDGVGAMLPALEACAKTGATVVQKPGPQVQNPQGAPSPVASAPAASSPVAPTPAAPSPVASAPAAPSPVASAPAASAPVASAPAAPAPVAPAPAASSPVAPTPAAPSPVAPTPAASAPVASAPAAPSPVASAPAAPSPVAPTPAAPAPVASAPAAPAPAPAPVAPTPAASAPVAPAPAASASRAPAPVPPVPAPVVSGAVRWVADMDHYAAEAAARDDWSLMKRRFAAQLGGREPEFVVRTRSADGRRFIVMRFVGFADEATAQRFCRGLRDKKRNCDVRRLTAE